MNCHFPQSELGRAEAMVIARTDQQYLVPTDGGVLSGLIQDHVCAGVDMTARGTLLSRDKYMQLLYVALRPDHDVASAGDGNIEQRLLMGDRGKLITLPPAIVKPRPMWTGKQVISTILLNLTYNQHPLNMISKAKVPAKAWGGRSVDGRMQLIAPEEDQVVVMEGDLVTGVLDKSQFGATSNGLVHCIYEVYGAPYAGKLLGILGRLFTHYWQHFGLTCRFDDLRLTAEGDVIRRELIAGSSEIGLKAAADYVKVDMADAVDPETRASSHMLQSRLEAVVRDNERLAGLDSAMKEHTNRCTSSIINTCVPGHLYKPFPANNLQLMTVSGAKGSPVNVSQISCCLGQQELEGRRVPVMISGKTLTSFRAFDPAACAGG
ncbi:beta and beta-prime subunits of DNA dependent RNA-polymerase, partial [Caulochytrium protostelioides]